MHPRLDRMENLGSALAVRDGQDWYAPALVSACLLRQAAPLQIFPCSIPVQWPRCLILAPNTLHIYLTIFAAMSRFNKIALVEIFKANQMFL